MEGSPGAVWPRACAVLAASAAVHPRTEAGLVACFGEWALLTGSSATGSDGLCREERGVGDPWLALSPRTLHRSLQPSKISPEKWPGENYTCTAFPRKPETQVREDTASPVLRGWSRPSTQETIFRRSTFTRAPKGPQGALAICLRNNLWLSQRWRHVPSSRFISVIYLFNKRSWSVPGTALSTFQTVTHVIFIVALK